MKIGTVHSPSDLHSVAAAPPGARPLAAAAAATPTRSSTPADTFVPSGKTPPPVTGEPPRATKAERERFVFDLDAFENGLRETLLQQIGQAREALRASGIAFVGGQGPLFDVDPAEMAAQVPEEWGADATARRIVDFAMGFAPTQGEDVETFAAQIRASIEEGFRLARKDIGDVPGPVGKLFNDTYEKVFRLLDEALAALDRPPEIDRPAH